MHIQPSTIDTSKRKHPLAKCETCPLYEKGKYVPPDFNGRETARFVIVGEAPGQREVKRGKPFVGVSGKLLDAVMEESGLRRTDGVYTNTVLCRPPSNSTPSAVAVACCKPALDATIAKAEPTLVVAMGNVAASAILGRTVKITKDRVGPPKDIGKPYKVIPTIHPAACLRNTNLFPAFAADIGKLRPQVYIEWEPPQYRVFDDESTAIRAIDQLGNLRQPRLVLDLEVGEEKDTGFGHPNTLLCAGMAYAAGKAVVIGEQAFRSRRVRQNFSRLLSDKKITCQHGKYDLGVLYRMGFGHHSLAADTMLMSYTQDEVPGTHSLGYLGQEHLGTPDWKDVTKPYKSWMDIPKSILYQYNAYDVGVTWDLVDYFEPKMDEHDRKLHRFLCEASDQLVLIESDGIYIDRPLLEDLDVEMQEQLATMKLVLQGFVETHPIVDPHILSLIDKGGGFNPNSPMQVKAFLQEQLGATLTTTDADTLDYLTNSKSSVVRTFAAQMLEWRKTGKLYGTYVKGILQRIEEDGRLRTTYLLHGTETGRLSSRNPNVQNVPRVDPNRDRNIRDAFAASPGNVFIYADYANIEGRVVSILADDKNMQAVLSDSSRDIHSEMALAVFGANFTKHHRFKSKSIVHGKNYDRSPDGIASDPQLGLSLSEARKISDAYDRQYPNVSVWHEKIKQQVLQTEDLLITPYGRKRRFGLITADNQEDVYKEALAFQPQSIGSDICLTAAIRLRRMGFAVRLLVHDGIGIEVPKEQVQEAIPVIRKVMEDAAKEFTEVIPFPVDIQTGRSWGEVED